MTAALLEQADIAFSEGNLDSALRHYSALLSADDDDVYSWYRIASILGRRNERELAISSLEQAAYGLAEAGQLFLAVSALGELNALSETRGSECGEKLAALYSAGSSRVDKKKGPPPMRKERAMATLESVAQDPKVLIVEAVELCEKALKKAGKAQRSAVSLPFHPLLSDLKADDLSLVLPLMKPKIFAPTSLVIEEGTPGASLFVIARGVAEVKKGDVHLAYLRSGAFFGEMALLTNSPRTASVTAHGPLSLLEIELSALHDLASVNPSVASVLADYTRQRLLKNLMATSQLFAPLEAPRREALIELFRSSLHEAGDVVLSEGEPSEGLYVVLSGAVRVTRQEEGDDLALAELTAGQVFGEISLIQQRAATATVTASCKTVILQLHRDDFNQRVADFPEVLAHVYRLASQREQSNRALEQSQSFVLHDLESLLI
jgi:CRP-like cAMP-binding protein